MYPILDMTLSANLTLDERYNEKKNFFFHLNPKLTK